MKNKKNKHLINLKSRFIAFFLGLTLFFGLTSVLATWPSAPLGENIAGWLGEIFNLNESGSGKLALNSKKILLPTNADPILENKQIPTKEYVDTRVSASGGASGGGALTLIGGSVAPNCPSGYSPAMDGYWNCGYVSAGSVNTPSTDCFCGQLPTYNIPSRWYTDSGGVRCAVCVPSASGGGASTDSTIIWATKTAYNGNLGGRAGADAKCVADLPDYLNGKCSNVHAFLSVNGSDEIRDMPNCDPDMDGNVKSWYDCRSSVYWFARQYNKFTQMANSWQDLSDASISVSASSADVYNTGNGYWTGSNHNLAYADGCSGWTDSTNASTAAWGNTTYADSMWIIMNSLLQCGYNNSILCACKMN